MKENEDFEKSQAYQSILYTLRAIASNDERIIEYFKDKANGIKRKGNIKMILSNQLAKILTRNFKTAREIIARLSWDHLMKLNHL